MRHEFFLPIMILTLFSLFESSAFAQAFNINVRGSAEFYTSATCQSAPPVTWEELTELAIENGERQVHVSCRGTHEWTDGDWTINKHCGSVYSGPADPIFKYTVRATRGAMCIPY